MTQYVFQYRVVFLNIITCLKCTADQIQKKKSLCQNTSARVYIGNLNATYSVFNNKHAALHLNNMY